MVYWTVKMLHEFLFGMVNVYHHFLKEYSCFLEKKLSIKRQTGHSLLVTLWGEHNPIRISIF